MVDWASKVAGEPPYPAPRWWWTSLVWVGLAASGLLVIIAAAFAVFFLVIRLL